MVQDDQTSRRTGNTPKWLKLPTRISMDKRLTYAAKVVYSVLLYRVGDRPFAWPSLADIQRLVGGGEKTVRRAVEQLEELGFIRVERAPRGGRAAHYYLAKPGEELTPFLPGIVKTNPGQNDQGNPGQNDRTSAQNPGQNDREPRSKRPGNQNRNQNKSANATRLLSEKSPDASLGFDSETSDHGPTDRRPTPDRPLANHAALQAVIVELWFPDAVMTPRKRKRIRSLARDYAAEGATPSEIKVRLERYQQQLPEAMATAEALLRQWDYFAKPGNGTPFQPRRYTMSWDDLKD